MLTFLLFYFLYSYYFVYAIWVQAPTLRGVVNSYILQHSRGPRHRSSILSLSPCSLVYRQVYSHVPCSAHLKDATVVNAEGSKVSRLVCCLLLWITLTAPIEAPSPHLAVFLSSPAAQLWTSSDSRCRVWLWGWGIAKGMLCTTCAGVIGAWYFAE